MCKTSCKNVLICPHFCQRFQISFKLSFAKQIRICNLWLQCRNRIMRIRRTLLRLGLFYWHVSKASQIRYQLRRCQLWWWRCVCCSRSSDVTDRWVGWAGSGRGRRTRRRSWTHAVHLSYYNSPTTRHTIQYKTRKLCYSKDDRAMRAS